MKIPIVVGMLLLTVTGAAALQYEIERDIFVMDPLEPREMQPFPLPVTDFTVNGESVRQATIFGKDYFPDNEATVVAIHDGKRAAETPTGGMPDDGDEMMDEGPAAITDVVCNKETRSLRFTITNRGEKQWDFARSGSTTLDTPARVFVNGYEATKPFPYYDPQGPGYLFGDGDANFVERCNGDRYLAPGESMTCTLQPVPLVPEGAMFGNAIWLDTPHSPTYFECT